MCSSDLFFTQDLGTNHFFFFLYKKEKETNKPGRALSSPLCPGKKEKVGGLPILGDTMRRFRVHLPWQLPGPLRSQSHRLARRIHASANSGARQGIYLSIPAATLSVRRGGCGLRCCRYTTGVRA